MKCGAILVSALLLLAAGAPAAPAADAGVIGSVKTVGGEVSVTRDGSPVPVAAGLRLRAGDILATGPDGSVGVILRDDASLSLGPSSRIALERFECSPAERKFGFTARLLRGTMAYLSGLIGRLAPDSARFETPVATVGIRGTRLALRVEG